MDILSFFGDLLASKGKKAIEEFENERQETKNRLAKQLKEQCYMNEQEVKQVLDVVDLKLQEIDDFTKNFDYQNAPDASPLLFESKLAKLRNELSEEMKSKIKEIMDAKLARAKKIFGKE